MKSKHMMFAKLIMFVSISLIIRLAPQNVFSDRQQIFTGRHPHDNRASLCFALRHPDSGWKMCSPLGFRVLLTYSRFPMYGPTFKGTTMAGCKFLEYVVAAVDSACYLFCLPPTSRRLSRQSPHFIVAYLCNQIYLALLHLPCA